MIPLVDLTAAYARQKHELDAALAAVVDSARFINGPEVAAFEAEYARFCGTAHAVGTGSGTAALHLSLAALGVGPGDVVAVPAHTFIATAEPVTWLGATPRFVEVDEQTGCLDPDALKAAVDGVAAVVPVHLYGRPADLAQITAIAADAGVPVVEDAAQAHGAELVEPAGTVRRAGGYAPLGCFSFFPGKNLGAFGDAGAVTTDDPDLAARLRMLRDHGRSSKYEHQLSGYAHRLDTIHAAVLRVKLLAHLSAAGIGAGVHYPVPLHLQPAYAHLGGRPGDLPVTEAWARECLSLPLYPELTSEQLDEVVAAVRGYFG
ncbi:MAG: hypothetical protein AUI14_17990 [Actinobacteria bacterium 13_2_20CM_2_71_6]|nr:MAG: hypothetical protein AUI14_17990 [Actinobacteria bacterium 13_2_20CM_2_71_6]